MISKGNSNTSVTVYKIEILSREEVIAVNNSIQNFLVHYKFSS